MSGTAVHSALIAEAAKTALQPLGLRRKGRSRVWLDDRGLWVNIVEFQPSDWTKGSYLNVGVTWLWHVYDDEPFLFFDVQSRVEALVRFEDEAQFASEARRLAESARTEIVELRRRFPNLEAAADWLDADVRRTKNEHVDANRLLDCGCAFVLTERWRAARVALDRLAGFACETDWEEALAARGAQILQTLDRPGVARREVLDGVARFRTAARLEPLLAGDA